MVDQPQNIKQRCRLTKEQTDVTTMSCGCRYLARYDFRPDGDGTLMLRIMESNLPIVCRSCAVALLLFFLSPAVGHSQTENLGRLPVFKFSEESYRGPLPKITGAQMVLSRALKGHVEHLAGTIGERNLRRPEKLDETARWLEQQLAKAGHVIGRQTYSVEQQPCSNLIVELAGARRPEEIIVVGAHYDSVLGAAGANDNGSGTAAVLELAKHFARQKPNRTLRFLFFVNEEPPHFQTGNMGSLVYARRCKERKENLVAVLSLETIGYYSDAENSQTYPPPIQAAYPSTGNFVGFVGNVPSGPLVERVVSLFRRHAKFPSEGGSLPDQINGVGWSDHWSFWEFGYQAVMVTDTAPFRYPHYHRATDTPDKLDYDRMARVVEGLEKVIEELTASTE